MRTLRERSQELSPSFYMTITSIIQSFALGFLLTSVGDSSSQFFTGGPGSLIAWLQVLAVLHLICITWHVNAINSVLFFYVFGLSDSIIPFLLGVTEFFLIKTVGPSTLHYWLYALAAFSFSALWAYIDMFRKVRGDPLNSLVLRAMDKYPTRVQSYIAFSGVLFLIFGLTVQFVSRWRGTGVFLLLLVNLITAIFTLMEVRVRGRLFKINPDISSGEGV